LNRKSSTLAGYHVRRRLPAVTAPTALAALTAGCHLVEGLDLDPERRHRPPTAQVEVPVAERLPRRPAVLAAAARRRRLELREVVVVELLVGTQRGEQELLDLHVIGAPDVARGADQRRRQPGVLGGDAEERDRAQEGRLDRRRQEP
jgi:hypothetical protein